MEVCWLPRVRPRRCICRRCSCEQFRNELTDGRNRTDLGGSGILDPRIDVSLHLWYVGAGDFILPPSLATASHVLRPSPGYYGNNIGLNEETAMAIPDEDLPRLIKGSQHAFMAWVCYIVLIWNLKGVLLLLYSRLTFVTPPTMGICAARIANRLTQHGPLATKPGKSHDGVFCGNFPCQPVLAYLLVLPS